MKNYMTCATGESHQKAALYVEQAVGQKSPGMTAVKHLSGPELPL